MRWAQGIIHNRPALPIAIAMVLGVVLHDHLPHRPIAWLCVASVFVLQGIVLIKTRFVWPFVVAATVMVGLAIAQIRAFYVAENDVARYATPSQRLVSLEARIESQPRVFGDMFARLRSTNLRQMMRARVTRICTLDGWQDCSGNVFLTTLELHPHLAAGEKILVNGWLSKPQQAMNPGQFDWAGYCARQGIGAVVFSPHVDDVQVIGPAQFGVLQSLRDRVRASLTEGFSDAHAIDHALLMDLLFGDNDSMLREVHEDFRKAGAAHLLCISGLHIVILAWFVFLVCRILRLHPRTSAIITTALIVLYGAVISPSAPAYRAIALSLAYTITLFLRRKVDPLHLLSLVMILMLIVDPLELYAPGFQLSFFTVAGLVSGAGKFKEFWLSFRDRDILVAQSFRPPTGVHWLFEQIRHKCVEALSAAIVAWSISLPLIAWHFSQFNPFAALGAVILTPFTFFAMIAGILKIVLTMLWPTAAQHFAVIAVFGSALLRHGTACFAHLPGSNFPVPPLSPVVMMLYFICILTVMLPLRRWMRFTSAGACGLFLLLPFQSQFVSHGPAMKITLLSLGAGQCAVVEPRGSDALLFDAGSSSIVDVDATLIEPFLRYEGISQVDSVFLSHGDFDHISAVEPMAHEHLFRQIFMSPHFRHHAYQSYPAEHLLETLDDEKAPTHFVTSGDHLPINRTSDIEVLWPPAKCDFSSNNCGIVLRITCNNKSILFPADIQVDAMQELLKHPERLKSDILVAPHHGSAEITTPDFVKAVSPQIILSSNDNTLTTKQHNFDRIVSGTKLLRTHTSGALTISITDDGEISVEPFAGKN